MMPDVKCPDCKGDGSGSYDSINDDFYPCRTCDGKGSMSGDRFQALKEEREQASRRLNRQIYAQSLIHHLTDEQMEKTIKNLERITKKRREEVAQLFKPREGK